MLMSVGEIVLLPCTNAAITVLGFLKGSRSLDFANDNFKLFSTKTERRVADKFDSANR